MDEGAAPGKRTRGIVGNSSPAAAEGTEAKPQQRPTRAEAVQVRRGKRAAAAAAAAYVVAAAAAEEGGGDDDEFEPEDEEEGEDEEELEEDEDEELVTRAEGGRRGGPKRAPRGRAAVEEHGKKRPHNPLSHGGSMSSPARPPQAPVSGAKRSRAAQEQRPGAPQPRKRQPDSAPAPKQQPKGPSDRGLKQVRDPNGCPMQCSCVTLRVFPGHSTVVC